MRFSEREYIVTAQVMRVLRQGLYLANYHHDPALGKDLFAVCGVDLEDFDRLMEHIDDLTKQRDRFPRRNEAAEADGAIRHSDGEFIVSAAELFTLRQGLLVTTHYINPLFSDDIHALSGFDPEDFAELMEQIDALG